MRIQNAVLAWIIAAFFALPQGLQAQETIEHYSQRLTLDERACADFSKPINILSDQNGKYTLVFSDAAKGVVTKTIDIRENNPFSGLGKRIKGDYYDTYVTGNKKFSDLFPGFVPDHYADTPCFNNTTVIDTAYVSCRMEYSENRRFAVVAYVLGTDVGACRTIFFLFDSTGNELSQNFADNNVNRLVITDDGKYIAYTFGTWDIEEGSPIVIPGVKIIQATDGVVFVNREINNLSGIFAYRDLIVAGTNNYFIRDHKEVRTRWFFDINKKKVYSKELEVNCIGRSKIQDDGILMRCLDGTSYKLLFLRDFIVEDLL